MNNFISTTGKYYAFNPFGAGKYDFAEYPSKDHYQKRLCLPTRYLPSTEAYKEHKEDDGTKGYLFTVNINGEKENINTSYDGIINGTQKTMSDYLTELYGKHGKQNVTFKYIKL